MPFFPAPWRSEAHALMALAMPLILGNLAQSMIYATDLVLLGRLSADALAAGSLAVNIYGPFLMFGTGLLSALAPMIATERGRKKHSVRDVRRSVRQGLWVGAAITIPSWLILWHGEEILVAFGQEPALAAQGGLFLQIVMWSLPAYFIHLALRFYISAMERAFVVFIVLFATVFVNAIASWALIFGRLGMPAMGFAGAPLGSLISTVFLCLGLVLAIVTSRHFRRYHLFGRWWRSDWQRFAAIWKLGLPIAIMIILEIGVFNAAVFVMGMIDRTSLAAHAIAIQIAAFAFMVPMGVGQAATVRVGLGVGMGDRERITRAGWLAFIIGVGFMCTTALTLLLFPRALVGIFLDLADPANAAIIATAVSFLAVAALFQIVDGAQVVGAGVLRGLHDTRWPMIYAVIGYWVIGAGIGITLAFPLNMRGVGIWLGLASGLAVVAVLVLIRWINREKLGLVLDTAPEMH
ncbi:MAG: MATE family efflux transporter [Pseudomonadota bacterium]